MRLGLSLQFLLLLLLQLLVALIGTPPPPRDLLDQPPPRPVVHADDRPVARPGGGLDGQDADRGAEVAEVQRVVGRLGGDGGVGGADEGGLDGGPFQVEVAQARDDPEVLEDHGGRGPDDAVGGCRPWSWSWSWSRRQVRTTGCGVSVGGYGGGGGGGGEFLQEQNLAAECAEGGEWEERVGHVEVVLGAGGRVAGVVEVVVEGFLEGAVVVAVGRAFFLEAHDDGFAGVAVQKVKDGQEHVGVGVAGVAVGVVDEDGVVVEAAADVEVADAGAELGGEVVVLALVYLVPDVEGEGVVGAGDGEAGEVGLVWDGAHPRGVVDAVHVKRVLGVIGPVAVVPAEGETWV